MNQPVQHTEYTREELIDIISAFIREKGIEIKESDDEPGIFFPGIAIRNGVLVINRKQMLYPGDLLHEAGHIAVAEDRPALNGDVRAGRPGKEGEEMSVMLWTYAACLNLNIPAEIVFHADGYKGESQWIIEQYCNGNYIGLPLLVWMGLAHDSQIEGGFPKMIKWVK